LPSTAIVEIKKERTPGGVRSLRLKEEEVELSLQATRLNPLSSGSFVLAIADVIEVLGEATALGPKRKLRISDSRHTNQLATKRMAVIPVPESNIEIDGYDMMFGLPKLDEHL